MENAELKAKAEIHKNLCEYIHNLYETKNSDYGDSMHPLYEEYGLTAFNVLFSIKLNRIKSLMTKDKPNYESLEDTLMDLANYALIALTEMKNEQEKKKAMECKQMSDDEILASVHWDTEKN